MTDITDIHTHILPGIDDGALDWETCRKMLEQSFACGVNRVIATPHYLPWKKNVSTAKIREMCQAVQEKMREETGIAIDVYPGQEIYYHGDIAEHLKAGYALTLADSRYVLVEFSTGESYSTICRAVHNLREAGYIPIIAHVERYESIRKAGGRSVGAPEGKNDEKTGGKFCGLKELHALGALFQMNMEVLQLNAFHQIGRWAKKALEQNLIHFLASDMHNLQTRPPMAEEQLCWLGKHLNQEYQDSILYGNSSRMFW